MNSLFCSMFFLLVVFLYLIFSWEIVFCRKDVFMLGDDFRICIWDIWFIIWLCIIVSFFLIIIFLFCNFFMVLVLLLSLWCWDFNFYFFLCSLCCIEDSFLCCLLYFDLKLSNCFWSWWFCWLRFFNFVFYCLVCK